MKLYSIDQMAKRIALSIFITLAVCSITFVAIITHTKKKDNITISTNKTLENLESNSDYILNTDDKTLSNARPQNVSTSMYTDDELQNISVYDKCNDAVANITTTVMGYDWFFEPVMSESGSGSGVIIDKRGYILTNTHVIDNAAKIYVSLSDGSQYEAKIIGKDSDSDLSVIKFTPPQNIELKTIAFGDDSSLKVGQKVIAIGNPFGFNKTMTVGIISALGRPIKNSKNQVIRNMIQTDTAINPGNSGGPLLDTTGRIIGINTMIYSSSGSNSGISFAIPSSTARRVASDLLQYGVVQRGILQARLVQLNSRFSLYVGLDISSGILISQVVPGGNAQKAGITGGNKAVRYSGNIVYYDGDVITKINDTKVLSFADYYSIMESKRPGDSVNLTLHRNGKDRVVQVELVSATIQQ